MLRTVGGTLLLVAVVIIFLIARQWPFNGIVQMQFSEFWLWFVLAVTVIVAGLGGYLLFTRRHIEI